MQSCGALNSQHGSWFVRLVNDLRFAGCSGPFLQKHIACQGVQPVGPRQDRCPAVGCVKAGVWGLGTWDSGKGRNVLRVSSLIEGDGVAESRKSSLTASGQALCLRDISSCCDRIHRQKHLRAHPGSQLEGAVIWWGILLLLSFDHMCTKYA